MLTKLYAIVPWHLNVLVIKNFSYADEFFCKLKKNIIIRMLMQTNACVGKLRIYAEIHAYLIVSFLEGKLPMCPFKNP